MRWLGIHPSDFPNLDQSVMKELSDVGHVPLVLLFGRCLFQRHYTSNFVYKYFEQFQTVTGQ